VYEEEDGRWRGMGPIVMMMTMMMMTPHQLQRPTLEKIWSGSSSGATAVFFTMSSISILCVLS
jgi:hypothetical protein